MIPATLVIGRDARRREQAIADAIIGAPAKSTSHPAFLPSAATNPLVPVGLTARGTVADPAIPSSPSASPLIAVLIEGLPAGNPATEPLALAAGRVTLETVRIAPGCLCCGGHLPLRVMLNRLLRRKPDHLYLSLTTDAHLDTLRAWLTGAPYDTWLRLTTDLTP